jgi:HD-GYP domain-containing protein (c-di-GMP phosphodiesterase class II)
MSGHEDNLSELNGSISIESKLRVLHQVIRRRHSFLDRISVALYDEKLAVLKTFLSSSGRDYPLEFYEARLEDAPSLQEIVKTGKPRIINDLSLFSKGEREHTKSILEQGYRSSYTVPMYIQNSFSGFVFFNSYQSDCFMPEVLQSLDVFAHLISAIVGQEIIAVRAMLTALKSAAARGQDSEKRMNSHLIRVSRYSRIIALDLARSGKASFTDEDIEKIFMLSPFHEAGKIASQQEGRGDNSSPEDFARRETEKGMDWLYLMIENFGFESFDGLEVLENITRYHREHIDGTGYPDGLKGKQIPIEARIVSVAHVFDAMTCQASNQSEWSNDEAFAMLTRLSHSVLDEQCVLALINNKDKIEQIQTTCLETDTWIS